MLASDISRSVAIITPLVLLGAFTWREAHPKHAPATLLVIATANLLIPAAHVVYNKMALIYPLPIELFRLLR